MLPRNGSHYIADTRESASSRISAAEFVDCNRPRVPSDPASDRNHVSVSALYESALRRADGSHHAAPGRRICPRDMQCISTDDWSQAGGRFIVELGECRSTPSAVSFGREEINI
jgi:hypothetical protein